MNSGEFKEQLQRLRARYGEKAYDDDFARLLWKDAQKYPDGAMTKAIDAIVGEHFRPIGRSAILEIIKQESAKFPGGKRIQSRIEPKECADCMGDGLLFLFNEQGYKSVFSCASCPNGELQRQISGNAAPHVHTGLKIGYRRSHVRKWGAA